MTTINGVAMVDLTTFRRKTLARLRDNMQKLQRWSGGYQSMIDEIDQELQKENRPADMNQEQSKRD